MHKQKVTKFGSQKFHFPKVTKGSTFGHRIDYNGVGVLRGQRPPLGGTPLYKPYSYMPPKRVGFLRRFGI